MSQHIETREAPRTKAFLRWAGSKRWLASALLEGELLPRTTGRYYEPFLGSGGFFFALAGCSEWRSAQLSDVNGELMACFQAVRDAPRELWDRVDRLLEQWRASPCRSEFYNSVRAHRPSKGQRMAGAARFLFLNSLCFNGLYRTNAMGEFNVPMGRLKSRPALNLALLEEAARALAQVNLSTCDFREAIAEARAGDLVVMDPPYMAESGGRGFTQYNGSRFSEGDFLSVRTAFRQLTERGCHTVLTHSRAAVPYFADVPARILELRRRRRIAAKMDARRVVSEFAFLNYDPSTGNILT